MAAQRETFTADSDPIGLASTAIEKSAVLRGLIAALACDDRRLRQFASGVASRVAAEKPELLKPYADELADALHRPEPQTRWEVLGVFEALVGVDARLVDRALGGAETALHDEESGVVRLAAFKLLASYGSTTERRSERVWPLIAEAVRCYHGDPEFQTMLSSLYKMVSGGSSEDVKRSAAELMAFDAENAKGALKKKAQRIVDCAPKKRRKK